MAEQASRPSTARSGSASSTSDWPTLATDTIVSVVGQVRDKTTGPILTAARAVVFGIFIAIVGVLAVTVFCIAFIRLTNNYIFQHHVWGAYLSLGLILTVLAAWLWSKAKASPAE